MDLKFRVEKNKSSLAERIKEEKMEKRTDLILSITIHKWLGAIPMVRCGICPVSTLRKKEKQVDRSKKSDY